MQMQCSPTVLASGANVTNICTAIIVEVFWQSVNAKIMREK